MTAFLDQLGYALLFCMGIVWSIVVFFHTITFPINEDSMRRIIREEIREIIIQEKQYLLERTKREKN